MTILADAPVARFDYQPTERQALAHAIFADEVLYGGAAGGGKSRWMRAEHIAFALEVPGSASLILRRGFPDLGRAGGHEPQLRLEMPPGVATYNSNDHRWTFTNGSTIELGHLARDGDVTKYQGAEYQLIAMDEATQFTEFQATYLRSRLRASGVVRDRLRQLDRRPRMILSANPGGIGHGWVKSRYIDPAQPEHVWRPVGSVEEPRPGTRVFIPAKVTDNPHIDENYIDRLNSMEDDTRRALRDGDWDVYQGQRFRHWRRHVHVVDPEELPLSLGGVQRVMGVDYGMDAPFCALWGALLPDNRVVIYRELYLTDLTPEQQAEAIADAEIDGEREGARRIPIALDPSTWARSPHSPKPAGAVGVRDPDTPPPGSIAAAYRDRFGSDVIKARNDRLAGVALVGERLRVRADGLPGLLVYSTCRNLIRTLPSLPRDEKRPEDVDTHAEDHAYDALRYLLMATTGMQSAEVQGRDASRARDVRGLEPSGFRMPGFMRPIDLGRAGF